ncbi:Adenosine (5')-pentaphospho-(5'')-adenosine pyrophosphohydrolase [hydrothermal vent metagenome]|uniref:Adenosine (5')-pentaphospho-(5'')-adenosine pyrophosphohydrolase n=1 Tax=hydrothermal vent metagenome TaxID=652676 RepID=A0A3B0TRF3_9ZZZZ
MNKLVNRDDFPYRDNAGVVLFNPRGKVFIGRRMEKPGQQLSRAWQLPQGGIDNGEAPYDAARRELAEETNVSSAQLICPAKDWLSYDFPDGMFNKRLGKKYRGQRQMWYAMLFTGNEDEIDLAAPGDGGHKPEFSEWRWEKLDNLPDLVVEFKRDVYRQLVLWFSDLPDKIRSGEISRENDSQPGFAKKSAGTKQ